MICPPIVAVTNENQNAYFSVLIKKGTNPKIVDVTVRKTGIILVSLHIV